MLNLKTKLGPNWKQIMNIGTKLNIKPNSDTWHDIGLRHEFFY